MATAFAIKLCMALMLGRADSSTVMTPVTPHDLDTEPQAPAHQLRENPDDGGADPCADMGECPDKCDHCGSVCNPAHVDANQEACSDCMHKGGCEQCMTCHADKVMSKVNPCGKDGVCHDEACLKCMDGLAAEDNSTLLEGGAKVAMAAKQMQDNGELQAVEKDYLQASFSSRTAGKSTLSTERSRQATKEEVMRRFPDRLKKMYAAINTDSGQVLPMANAGTNEDEHNVEDLAEVEQVKENTDQKSDSAWWWTRRRSCNNNNHELCACAMTCLSGACIGIMRGECSMHNIYWCKKDILWWCRAWGGGQPCWANIDASVNRKCGYMLSENEAGEKASNKSDHEDEDRTLEEGLSDKRSC